MTEYAFETVDISSVDTELLYLRPTLNRRIVDDTDPWERTYWVYINARAARARGYGVHDNVHEEIRDRFTQSYYSCRNFIDPQLSLRIDEKIEKAIEAYDRSCPPDGVLVQQVTRITFFEMYYNPEQGTFDDEKYLMNCMKYSGKIFWLKQE